MNDDLEPMMIGIVDGMVTEKCRSDCLPLQTSQKLISKLRNVLVLIAIDFTADQTKDKPRYQVIRSLFLLFIFSLRALFSSSNNISLLHIHLISRIVSPHSCSVGTKNDEEKYRLC